MRVRLTFVLEVLLLISLSMLPTTATDREIKVRVPIGQVMQSRKGANFLQASYQMQELPFLQIV